MKYKTNEIAKLAGISTRTLRYYDQINLLKPKRDLDSNYRFYDKNDVDKLQQILLYKEMGLELNEIKKMMMILNSKERIKILDNHLVTLNKKQVILEKLVKNVKNTIKNLKGEIIMSDKDKFEGLKDELIRKNHVYKDEVIANWGKEIYEKSHKRFKNMNEEQFKHFNNLDGQIIEKLQILKKDISNEVLEIEIAKMHQEWITMAWGWYDRQIHLNVVDMYIEDDRFKSYYDKHESGIAKILRNVVHKHI